jgi:hypothetical protein
MHALLSSGIDRNRRTNHGTPSLKDVPLLTTAQYATDVVA